MIAFFSVFSILTGILNEKFQKVSIGIVTAAKDFSI